MVTTLPAGSDVPGAAFDDTAPGVELLVDALGVQAVNKVAMTKSDAARLFNMSRSSSQTPTRQPLVCD